MTLAKVPPDEAVQQHAYATLTTTFNKYQGTQTQGTLSIEILPPGIDPLEGHCILEDEAERSVGIPKKVLVAAFLQARCIFLARAQDDFSNKDVLAATRVILLFDPEYLTAANHRKRHLLHLSQLEDEGQHHTKIPTTIQSELWFLECILTSPLHRQSKSPTLWYYRRWIYSTFTPQCEFLFASKSCVLKELEIILKAAEQHQHNYYAFQYARRILDFGIFTARQRDKSNSSGTIHDDISDTLYEWCRSHPSDTSGWSLLRTWMEPAYTSPTSQRRIEATLKFGMDMQWKGEAMWSFLRNLVGLDQEYQEGDELDEVTIRIRDAIVEFCPSLDRSSVPRDRGPSG